MVSGVPDLVKNVMAICLLLSLETSCTGQLLHFLTLSPPRVSLRRVKSSSVRQSKIFKGPLVVKGLREIVFFNPFTTKGLPLTSKIVWR